VDQAAIQTVVVVQEKVLMKAAFQRKVVVKTKKVRRRIKRGETVTRDRKAGLEKGETKIRREGLEVETMMRGKEGKRKGIKRMMTEENIIGTHITGSEHNKSNKHAAFVH
jgi:hypothetical protein